MTLTAYNGGSWKAAAPYAYNGGSWKLALSVKAYNGGSWKIVAQILTSVAITGSTTVANGATVNLGTTVTGGYGTLTYLWEKVSGTGTISGSATNSTVTILSGANNSEGDYQVTVTDSLTGTSIVEPVLITWGTPP